MHSKMHAKKHIGKENTWPRNMNQWQYATCEFVSNQSFDIQEAATRGGL